MFLFFRLILGLQDDVNPYVIVNASEAVVKSISNDESGCFLDLLAVSFNKGSQFKFNISSLNKIYQQGPVL